MRATPPEPVPVVPLSAEDRLRRFEALSRALSTAQTVEEVASVTAREASLAAGAIASIVMTTRADPETLELVGSHGVPAERARTFQKLRVDAGYPICRTFSTGKTEWYDAHDEYQKQYGALANRYMPPSYTQAIASLPLVVEGKTVGAVGLSFETPRSPKADGRLFVQTLVDLCAQAFERARRLESEREARTAAERASLRSSRLAHVTAALARAVSPRDVAATIVDAARQTLGAFGGAVLVLEGEDLVILGSSGYPDGVGAVGTRLPRAQRSPPAQCIRDGRPVYNVDASAYAELYPDVNDKRVRAGGDASVWLPLRAREQSFGAFGVSFGEPRAFPADDRAFLEAIAETCAQALERAHLYDTERTARADAERVGVFLEAGDTVAREVEPARIVARLGEVVVPALADLCVTMLLDDESHPTVTTAEGVDPADVAALLAMDPVAIPTSAQVLDASELPISTPTVSAVRAPIAAGARLVGSLLLVSRGPGRYTARDARLVEKLASRAAFALENARLIGELRQRAETEQLAAQRMRVLAEASRAFSEARLDVHRIATSLASLVAGPIADGAIVLLVTDDGAHLEPIAVRHADPERQRFADDAVGSMQARVGEGLLGSVVATGEPALVHEPELSRRLHPAVAQYVARFGVGGAAVVPLRLGGRVIGALAAVRDTGGRLDADDLSIVQDLADRASVALANARLHGAEQTARKHVERLQAVTSALGEAISPEQVADVILDSVMQELGGDIALYYEAAEERGFLALRRSRNLTTELAAMAERLPLERAGLCADSFAVRTPLFVENRQQYKERYPTAAEAAGPWLRLSAFASLPLVIGAGQVHGVVLVSFREPRVFSAVDRAFAMNLAEQSAQALDRARLYAGERAAKRGAEEASRLKDEFLATVSHELRTPLNAILGWASMLRSGRLDLEAVERALATIERNARAQARLVDDVLDVSRIISGKLAIRTEPLDVGSVLQQALDVVRPAALAKEVSVEVEVARSLRVRGDADRLQQVYWNVLSNAVKFTPRRGKISVRAFASDGSVVVTVSDTGQGVCPDFLPHLFEPFRQADGSTTRTHGGLGLGLSIAKHLVQLHGGEIAASSPGEGRGSTFTITLPETGEVPAMLSTGRHRPAARLRGLDILVVDDDDDARELTAMVLAGEGAEVRTASSARKALEQITDRTPAILVCDIGMPEEDGLSLLPRARAAALVRGERFPALAFTAYADAEHAELVQRAGFDAHLTKPVDAPALVGAVADLASAGPTSSSAALPGSRSGQR